MRREVPVEFRPANLPGLNSQGIDADPLNAGYVAISNSGNLYATADNGDNWTKIRGKELMHLDAKWVDKKLVVQFSQGLLYTSDLGQTWHTLVKSQYGSDYFNMRQGKQGRLWVTLQKEDSSFVDFTIEPIGPILKLKSQTRDAFEQRQVYNAAIYNAQGDRIPSSYAVSSVNGYWAATEAGPYFASKDDVSLDPLTQALKSKSATAGWQARLNGINAASVSEIIVSPHQQNLIVTRSGGNLWRSEDFGHHWQQLQTAGYVVDAHYLQNGSLLVVFENKRINLIGDEKTVDISPSDDNYFYKSLDEYLAGLANQNPALSRFGQRKIDRNLTRVFSLGDDGNQLWLVLGDDSVYDYPSPVDDGFYARLIRYKKTIDRFAATKITRIGVFTYATDQGWRFQPLQALQQLENKSSNKCKLSLNGYDLFLNDKPVPGALLGRNPVRADWMINGESFYVLSEWKLEIVPVSHCGISGAITAWDMDGAAFSVYSNVFNTAQGIRIVTPSEEGVKVVNVDFSYPPLWRWLLYHLSFGIVNYMVWGGLFVWMILVYYSRRVNLTESR